MNRASSLTRTPMPARKTPMPGPSAPMPRGEWLSRSGGSKPRGIRGRSKKTAQLYQRERIPLVIALLAERPLCEIRWDDGCQGRSADVHEVLSRGRSGSITDVANCRVTCRYCHGEIDDHPAEAEARGFLLPSGRPSKAVPR